ncbi:hypothetical protein [Neotabrizicola shimadae]|uniref:Uncharacterized protein n=1 Tax=Neotabrizicola shimadae TaxID=2807096 RepID=A0A8G1ECU5_9RHOB|nr:hypothetical protein [Neotabrizicola shimadae]QYZ68729.1 hypothetical protein JO391_13240 [Neotabrizicola shimadae]
MIRAHFDHPHPVDRVGEGVRVLLLTCAGTPGRDALIARLCATGAEVETAEELYSVLGDLMDDSSDYGLFVMECDAFGGVDAGRRAAALLGQLKRPLPVILLTADRAEQHFPDDWRDPAILHQPVSSVALRVGMEQLLHRRFDWDRPAM